MTQAIATLSSQPRLGIREAGLWTSAAAIILAAHVAVAYAVQNLSFAEAPGGGSPPALEVEMAPLPTTPAVPEEVVDKVTPDQPDAAEETETPAEVKPATDPVPAPVVEEAKPVTDQPVEADKAEETEPAEQTIATLSEQQPLEEVVPDPVEAIAPEVAVRLPQPNPVGTEIKANKPVEAKKKAERKLVEKPKRRSRKEKAEPPKAVTTASIDARAGAKAAAPQSSDAAPRSSVGPSRWNASLQAWIRRHTRYPSAAKSRRAEGTPNVTFTVDASGRVVSARLARSSGDADLDRAALGALQGASVPAPPAELGQRVTRTAPFVFSLRD